MTTAIVRTETRPANLPALFTPTDGARRRYVVSV